MKIAPKKPEKDVHFNVLTDHDQRLIRIIFPEPVRWFAMDTDDAREFAQILIDRANRIDSGDRSFCGNVLAE